MLYKVNTPEIICILKLQTIQKNVYSYNRYNTFIISQIIHKAVTYNNLSMVHRSMLHILHLLEHHSFFTNNISISDFIATMVN